MFIYSIRSFNKLILFYSENILDNLINDCSCVKCTTDVHDYFLLSLTISFMWLFFIYFFRLIQPVFHNFAEKPEELLNVSCFMSIVQVVRCLQRQFRRIINATLFSAVTHSFPADLCCYCFKLLCLKLHAHICL